MNKRFEELERLPTRPQMILNTCACSFVPGISRWRFNWRSVDGDFPNKLIETIRVADYRIKIGA